MVMPIRGMTQETTTKDAANITAADTKKDEPPAPSPNYSGEFWTRSTQSGDWWCFRNQLAEKGVTIDMSLTQSAQGIVHGGKDTGWQYGGGRGDIILNVDTQKLGLWPGGFLNIEAEGNFIPADTLLKSINGRAGALLFVNSNQSFPLPAGDNFNLPALNFTQFLSPYFGLTIGKYATITSNSGDTRIRSRARRHQVHEYTNVNSILLTTFFDARHRIIALPTKDPKRQSSFGSLIPAKPAPVA
jgi:hypothetical protein